MVRITFAGIRVFAKLLFMELGRMKNSRDAVKKQNKLWVIDQQTVRIRIQRVTRIQLPPNTFCSEIVPTVH